MKISDFSKKVGLNKKTVHYYIEQGLIHPKKSANNYYEFDEHNIKECNLIKVYRKLGVSITNIANTLKHPTFINYFLYLTAYQLKQELYQKQLQLENIKKVLDILPPHTSLECISNLDLTELNEELQYPSIANQYPLDTSYLLCCFLLVPWVSASSNQYRNYLFIQMSSLLYANLKESYNYLEHIIYSVDLEILNKSSQNVCYLMKDINSTNDVEVYYHLLKDKCKKLVNDDDLRNKWLLEYDKLIVPMEVFYNRVEKLLYDEYADDFKKCRNNLKDIFNRFVENEEDMKQMLQVALDKKINFDIGDTFNDLYMILIYDISLYVIEDIEVINKYIIK